MKRLSVVLALILALALIIGVFGCGGGKQYSLTIAVNGQGVTSPAAGTYWYKSGESVTISAIPDSDWKFHQWSGDASGTNAATTVTMTSDKSVTATFVLAQVTIFDSSVSIVSGDTYYLDLDPGYYNVDLSSDDGVTVEWIGGGVDQGYNSGATEDYHKQSVPVPQSTTFKLYNPTGIFFNPTALVHLKIVKVN
jgi:hypothetical protein